jgi:1-deoxy-D-xylulose-5-phosphate synthase
MTKQSPKTNLLDTLNFPEDVKTLNRRDMEQLAQEIRDRLKDVTDKVGGHLASNLGVVELTLALHSIFDSPKDKFLWDTSHQCYVHKMLTGRLDQMYTIKKYKGLSGFSKISESEHDTFGAGHASTSLSAALGVAHGLELNNLDGSVVAVVGDGGLSGGMAYEALNNAARLNRNFICILNDNNMSISHPVGSMSEYITSVRTSKVYNTMRNKFERIFGRIPMIGEPLVRKIEKTVDRLRSIVIDTKVGVLFEEFGFKYLGPIDGHNLPVLIAALKFAKSYKGPIMIHLMTTKGKGLPEAEDDPVKYHGVSAKAPVALTPAKPKPPTYTQVFGSEIVNIAEKDPKIMVITPAMREGSGLVQYSEQFPDRYFDVGIAEEHAVTFAAGLAKGGAKPVLAIYSTFLQRGYDQIIHDCCIQKLPVVFALDRAGLVGADGPTHHGMFDYNYLLPIPNMTILAPKDGTELRQMMQWACDSNEIVSIRYPRGAVPEQDGQLLAPFQIQKAQVLTENPDSNNRLDVTILAAGSYAWPSHTIAEALAEKGIHAAAINLRTVKPLDQVTVRDYVSRSREIFILEEGNGIGGIAPYILHQLSDMDIPLNRFHQIAHPDRFADHGSVDQLMAEVGMTQDQIFNTICTVLESSRVSAR